ncbi:hypothetical protein [Lentzea sp. E54]|uniref:hypothetical protein n=1 Tax=Lentzea xerophila TaxID=3435883 RepID=UPI003DA66BE7
MADSKADLWITDGKRGANVKVGIIDVGFGNLADAQDNGDLPATGSELTINNAGCVDSSVRTPHGTAVAELVHDMACSTSPASRTRPASPRPPTG